eukprot:gb/GEZN01006954.1/.p1 GENE.gb/GEZN01006954.1/~~gb/GEZN01006954.1/.p1  ORF type:complete len:425 (-),score=74.93 gb/GEZN01006954.1/:264-1538(-)
MGAGGPDEVATCTPVSAMSFLAGVTMGTVNTLVMKLLFDMQTVGVDGQMTKFEKPVFMALVMFAGMLLSLPGWWLYQRSLPKQDRDDPTPMRVYLLLAVPATFDLVGTILAQIGLLYVTASLFMLVRCFVIIVTALLKVFVLGHNLAKHMWLGVVINFVAMMVVSAPAFTQPFAEGERDPRIGIFFICLSCIVQGSQYVFEEKVMAVDGAAPMIVVGMEGFWGVLMAVIVCWPLCYYLPGPDKGSLENMHEAFFMLNDGTILVWMCVFFVSVAMYNVFAVFITHLLNSIWHAILDNFRPVAVWGVDLFIYYFVSQKFGERWVYPGSYLQLVGMIILFFGTAVYNGSVPCLIFSDAKEVEEKEIQNFREEVPSYARSPLISTPSSMASPYVFRSPLIAGKRKTSTSKARKEGVSYGSINKGKEWP